MKQKKKTNKIISSHLASFFLCLVISIGILVPVISISYAASYNGDGNGTGWWKATFSNTSYTWNAKASNTTSTLQVGTNASAKGYYGTKGGATTYTYKLEYIDNLKTKSVSTGAEGWKGTLYKSGKEYLATATKSAKLYKGGTTLNFSKTGTITFTRGSTSSSHDVYVVVKSSAKGVSARKIGTFTVPVRDYNITYNANGGGTVPEKQIKTHDKSITLSSVIPTREGYIFKNWNTKADGTGTSYKPSATFTANADTVLYAYWVKIPESCEEWEGYDIKNVSSNINEGYENGHICINFAKNENQYGTARINSSTTYAEEENTESIRYTASLDNAKTYALESNNSNYVKVIDNSVESVTTPIRGTIIDKYKYYQTKLKVLYPKGYILADVTNGKASWDTLSTTLYTESSVPDNSELIKDAVSGPFASDTWVDVKLDTGIEQSGLITSSNDSTILVVNQSANLNFIPNETKIHFDSNGGTGEMEDQEYIYDNELKLDPNAYNKENYVFTGWTCDKDIVLENGSTITAGNLINDESVLSSTLFPVEKEITLTANWQTTEKYTISYFSDSNGRIESNTIEQVLKGDTPYGVEETPSTGYRTIGWKCNKNVELTEDRTVAANKIMTYNDLIDIIVSEDLKCTALHTKEVYTIYYENAKGITWENKIEEIEYGGTPTNTYKVDEGFNLIGFTSNNDVTLNSGKVIKKGKTIPKNSLKKIKITGPLKIKALSKVSKVVKNPYTADGIKPYLAVSLLTFLGVTFFVILREDRKNKLN